jgi:uncharacterized protein (TIGR03067 family)
MPQLLLTVVVGLAALSQALRRDTAKEDFEALQGTWVLATVEWLGEVTPQDESQSPQFRLWRYRTCEAEERDLPPVRGMLERTTVTFCRNRFEFRQKGRISALGTFQLDVSQHPKVMRRQTTTYTYRICNNGFGVYPDQGKYASIYSLEGSTLKWCLRNPPGPKGLPIRFATDTDEEVYVLTFRRDRPRCGLLGRNCIFTP